MASCAQRRQLQFRATRRLAQPLLRQLGAPGPLLNNDDRSPRWPTGLCGSITHTDGWCGVTVALARDVLAVGIDVEAEAPLDPAIARRVLRDEEWESLGARYGEEGRLSWAKLVFSAKEAFYKCQYPLTSSFLSFADVAIHFDESCNRFAVAVHREALPPLPELVGSYRRANGVVATAAYALREP